MSLVIAWLISRGLSARVAGIVAWAASIALLIVASSAAWTLLVRRHDKAVIANHESGVQIEIERAGRAADRSLVERQAAGEGVISSERREFDNATRDIPPEGLTRRQRLDLCRELRDSGTNTTVLSQCRDIQTGGAATGHNRHPHQ